MNDNPFLKIISIVAFFAFAAVSCWATAESLILLLPSWPSIFCWMITIGFYIVAALGTKMIVESLNQRIYIEKRGVRLICGILLVLTFWLVCSMPTNTHTFMYRNMIEDVAEHDISTTQGYLSAIINNSKNERFVQLKCDKLDATIETKIRELEAEMQNELNPGVGPVSKAILKDIADELDVAEIKPLSYRGTSKQERDRLVVGYKSKIYTLRDSYKNSIKERIQRPNPTLLQDASINSKNLSIVKNDISAGNLNLNKSQDINEVCGRLNAAYSTISKSEDFIDFKNEVEKERYTVEQPVSNVKRMLSVFDVWKDFFNGKYEGRGFFFWIIVSILVDLAAFIFFDIAFTKKENQ